MAGYGNEQIGYEQKPPALLARLLKLGLFVGITGALLYSLLSLVQPHYKSATILYIEGPQVLSGSLVQREVKALGSQRMISSFLDTYPLSDDPAFNGVASPQGPLKRISILLGITDDPAKLAASKRILANLQKSLSVSKGADPQTIKIAMRSINATAAARLANQYARSYIARLEAQNAARPSTMTRNEQADLIAGLNDKVVASQAKLASLRQDMRVNPFALPALRQLQSGAANEALTDGTGKLTLEQLSQITAQLILARADHEQAELRARLVRDMLVDDGRIESTSTVLTSGLVQTLLRKRARMEQQRSELTVNLLPSHPQMRRLNRQLVALDPQIENETRKAVANLEDQVLIAAAREDSIKQSLAKLKETPLDGAGEAQASRSVEIQNVQPVAIDPRIEQMAMISREIADHRRNLMVAKAQAEVQSNKDMASSKTLTKATVVSPAIASSTPVFPKKKPITFLGMLAALILGLVGMIFGYKGNAPLRDEGEQLNTHTPAEPPQNVNADRAQKSHMSFSTKPA